jgi:hypothetical protein
MRLLNFGYGRSSNDVADTVPSPAREAVVCRGAGRAQRHIEAMNPAIPMTRHKERVRRLVDEVMNGNHLAVLDELCAPKLAPKLRLAFTQFRNAFPDWGLEDTWTRMRRLAGHDAALGELGSLS